MLTVCLVRDPYNEPPSYLTFVTDDNDDVLVQTIYRAEKYSEGILHAGILFELFSNLDVQNANHIACHIESPYESSAITSYSIGEFCAKKTSEHNLYMKLIDDYQSLLTRIPIKTALRIIREENSLTEQQYKKLIQLLKTRPIIEE